MTERLLARTLNAVAKRVDSGLFNDYPPLGGHDEHRRMLAHWFAGIGMEADSRRLILTSGAHHAVAVALSVTCGRHGTLFTEAQTYPGVIALARHQGIRLVGVATDGEGVVPEALERALSAREGGPAALYLTPTMQNPTTATMGRMRREDIASICRAHDVSIIEDDVYTLAADVNLPPLAMLAPERTFYVNSMSKTLNPTLRIGGLVTPPALLDVALTALQATAIMVSPLSCAFMEQWLMDGTADAVSQAIQVESGRRAALARQVLGGQMREPGHRGYHVWLPMPKQQAQRFEEGAKALGVLVTPAISTVADLASEQGGIRLCLGGASMSDLNMALGVLAQLQLEPGEAGARFTL